ncbi:uncharacterized protein LOC120841893, partial [Ixodes scapularis]|uniref:uncharacterized protein LOC120841893 n=1 Tax=Ixodes scapularis TaxID=6945 RepID=UPI001C394C9F
YDPFTDHLVYEQYNNAVEDLLDSILAAHNLPSESENRKRDKRSTSLDISIKDTLGVHRLQFVEPYASLCERQLSVSLVPYADELYVLCLSAGVKQTPARLTVGTLTDNKWIPLAHSNCFDPTAVVGFVFNSKLYMVIADAGLENGAELQFFDKDTRKIYIDHTINSARPTAVAFWQMKSTGDYNLALANSGKETSTSIYSWKATYFDKYASVESRVVRDLEPFSIHNSDFLVVVNQRFSKDTAKVSTVVFKYDISRNAWKTLQEIPTYAATDAEFFTLGRYASTKEFFLAVANQYEQHDDHRNYAVDSIVYKYVDGKFVPFQCLHTTGATKIAAYDGSDGEFLLAVASLYEPVHLYQYNGWHFVLAQVQYTQSTMGPGVRDLSFYFTQPAKHILLAVSNPATDGPGVYKISFYHDNQIQRWYDESLKWCQESSALATENSAAQLASQLDNVFYTDQTEPIRIPGEVVFQDLHVAESLRAPQFEELATGESYSIKNLQELEKLQLELNAMMDIVRKTLDDLEDALKLTGDQVIAGDHHFESLGLECPSSGCQVSHLQTTYLNKEDVGNLAQRLFFTNMPQTVDTPMSFDHLNVENLSVDGAVNGMNVSKLVTVTGNHVLAGNIRFARPIHTKDLSVSGTLGGLVFSQKHLMLAEGDQLQTGELTMTDATTHYLQVDGTWNGLNLAKFYRDSLTIDGNHVITGRKTFQKVFMAGTLGLLKGGRFNNVNLHDLWNNVLWTHKSQIVTAPHNYTNVHFKDISVRGTINGVRIPGPEVVLVNQNVTVSADKVFLDDCSASELHVNVAFNGLQRIHVPESEWKGQLDILVKTPAQWITGRKTFKKIHLNGQSDVGRFIDGVNLSELGNYMRRRRTPVMNGTWTFTGTVVFEDRVVVTGLVNGHKLDDLYRHALRLDAPVFPNYKRVYFASNIQARNLSCRDINGFDVPSSFVLRRGPKVVSGEKGFSRLVLNGPVTVKRLVNGVDLGVLQDSLLTQGTQVVKAPKVFKRNLRVKNLVVDGSINGVKVDEFCRLDENCIFTAPKEFETLNVAGGAALGNLVVRNTINGVKAIELVEDTMLYSARQVVTGTKSFPGNLTLPPNSNVQTSNFSGVKLAELYSEAVLLTGDQVIAGKTVFEAPVTAPNFEFYSTLDGVSQDDIENWMLQGVDQVVNGDLVFENNLETLAPLDVHDTINDVNLKDLAGRIAYKNESTTFTGPVRFAFLGSMADVHVTGTVQGIDVSEELVDGTKDVTITGRKFLKNGFLVDGDIWVNGLLDSVKVDDLCKRAVRVNTKQVITAPTVVIGNIVFHRGVAVGGLLDGIDVKEMDTACLKTDGDAIVRGTKKFRNLIVEGPVTIRGLLNGMNLNFLKHNYMSVSKDQVVEARLRMPKMQVRGNLHCDGIETRDVNGMNLPLFLNSTLRTGGDQVLTSTCIFGNATFNDVTVRGTVNGVRMPEDVFTKIRPNVMTGPLEILGNVTVRNTLTMPESARLQGVDIDAWANDAVFNDGREYVVKGRKVFNSLNVADSLINGTLDGVHVSPSELLLATGEQVITGKKIFRNGMTVADLKVAGFLNGVNLHEFIRMAMLKSRNNTVTAPKRFVGGFRVATLHTLGRVGNVSLQELKLKTRSMENIEALVMHLQQQKNRIDELNLAFKQQAVFVSYYDKIFSFTVGQSRSACYAQLQDLTELFLLTLSGGTSTSCGVLKTFRVDHGSYNLFPAQHDIAVAHGSSIYHLVLPGADFIIVANKNSAMACSKQRPQMGVVGDELGHSSIEILIWNSSIKALRLYQVVKIVDLQSLSLFHHKSQGCLAVVASGFLKIICLQDPSKGFRLLQNLPVHYSTGVSASHCPLDDSLLLAVSASQPGQFDRVFLYQWSQGLKKLASVPAVSVSSLAVVGHGGHCFVVVGQRRVGGADAATSVYRYLPGHPQAFLEVQRLLPGDVRSITWLPSPDNHTLLLFIHVGNNQGLKIYSFKGASGFVEQDSLHVDGSFNEVRTFRRSDGRHFVIMSSSHEEPSAVVLLSKLKGKPYDRP